MIELLQERGRGRLVPRPVRAGAARARPDLRAARACRRPTASRSSPRTRASTTTTCSSQQAPLVVDLRNATPAARAGERQGLEAVRSGVGQAGLGYWGPNLARNFGDARPTSRWLCDRRRSCLAAASTAAPAGARRQPHFDELLADPELDAVVIATPVVTPLRARRSRRSRPASTSSSRSRQAQSSAEAEELVALAQEREPRPDARPPAPLPPGRAEAEGADRREASSATCSASTGTARTSGMIRTDENALWSLGVHDLSVILHLVGEEPGEAWARGERVPARGRRGRRLLLPALPVRRRSRTCTSRGSTRTRCAS